MLPKFLLCLCALGALPFAALAGAEMVLPAGAITGTQTFGPDNRIVNQSGVTTSIESGASIRLRAIQVALRDGFRVRSGGSLRVELVTMVPSVITTQPIAKTVSVGQVATFTVAATGTPAPTYQWRKNGTAISGATSTSYTTPATTAADNNAAFSVVVTNGAGSVTSASATLTVLSSPTITSQPQSQSVSVGQSATFAVTASGSPTLTYQWRKNSVTIPGATTASYVTPAATTADSGALFSVVVTNSHGSVTSGDATLTVASPPSITTQPLPKTVTEGQPATFSVVAAGSPTPSYQWRRNGVNISGATNSSYTLSSATALDDGAQFSVLVTNANGAALSGTVTLTVIDAIWASLPPHTVYVVASETAYPSETANPAAADRLTTTYSYQWHPASTQFSRRDSTLPVVSTAQNGPGTATTTSKVFDRRGRVTWSRDADGYVHYLAYDSLTGALSRTITDVDTTRSTDFSGPAPFPTPTTAANPVAGGTHLIIDIENDAKGRPLKVTDPKGYVTYTVYKDAAHEVRVYPGWDAALGRPTGPTRISRQQWGLNYREALAIAGPPSVAGGRPTGGEEIVDVVALQREHLDVNGRVSLVDTYSSLAGVSYSSTTPVLGVRRTSAALGGHYERETMEYTARGHPRRVIHADGTIEHTIRDFLGRAVAVWKGTNVNSWTESTVDDTTSFALIRKIVYDGGQPGLGLITEDQTYSDHPTGAGRVSYVTRHAYDGRARLVRTLAPDRQLAVMSYDNRNVVIQAERYAGIVDVLAAPAVSARRARSNNDSDAWGRTWRTRAYAVDPVTGVMGNHLPSLTWFDRRGHVIKQQVGEAAFSKVQVDGAGRTIETWVGTDGIETWAAARTADQDVVAERQCRFFDRVGNVIATARYLRKDTATASGALQAADSHLSVMVNWFDLAHRPIAMADYGRDNGGTRYVISTTGALIGANRMPTVAIGVPPAPNSSDDYRVTRFAYSPAGHLALVTNNLGRIDETGYDLVGRVVATIKNRVDGVVSTAETDTDQTTIFTPAVGGGLAEQRVVVATGTAVENQNTRYFRTDPINAAIVTVTVYPDSADGAITGTDKIKTTYDRLGRMRTQTDQRGVVRAFNYDSAGRILMDRVTTVPTGVDGAVRRIHYGYNDQGRARTIGSFDLAGTITLDAQGHPSGVSSGGIQRDDVVRTWDGYGQLTSTAQAHEGAAQSGTPTVTYTYDDRAASGVARSLRATGVVYPSSAHGVTYRYPSTGLGAALNRLEAIFSNGQDIAQYEYLGLGTPARVTLPHAGNARVERSTGGAATGYDRFWSISQHGWAVGAAALDGWQYRHDRLGRPVTRVATWLTGRPDRDEMTIYDHLDRQKNYRRGIADAAGVIAPGASRREESWTLDHVGNWRTRNLDADGGAGTGTSLTQNRSHNLANEISVSNSHSDPVGDSITGGMNWTDPVYDAAGAMTTMPALGAETTPRSLIWDAFGRLVEVRTGVTTVWSARYDGQHRLIRWTAAGITYAVYLDEQGRQLEMRTGTGAGTLAEVSMWSRTGDRLLRSGKGAGTITTWYGVLTDPQGSVTALIADGVSAVLERYRYDPYGSRTITAADGETPRATSAYAMRSAFTGRPFDAVTGLGYFRARWYHASLGRFVSRDPAGYIDGGSLYAYAMGNPWLYADPSGLAASLAPDDGSGSSLDNLQLALDGIGFAPGIGILADLINAAISIGRGNITEGLVNGIGAVPLLGDGVKAVIIGRRVVNAADTAVDAARAATHAAPKAKEIVADLPYTFRGDPRSPDVIFKDGFQPRGTSDDIYLHAVDNKLPPSNFVPTSRSPGVAAGFDPTVYTVRPRNGVDVNDALGPRSPYPDELEIAIPGGIAPSDIRGVTLPGENMSHINPNFRR